MKTESGAGLAGPAQENLRLPDPAPQTRTPPVLPGPPVEPEYLRVRPFLKLSGWSKSRLYRINSERWPLLIKVEGATFVVIRIYRRYMAACPRVGRAR
jgi:hypothetical protein